MSLRSLSRNSLIIGTGLLASRLLAFVREALLARYFGLSHQMDALVVALSIPDFAVNLLMGGAAATVLLPGLSLAHQRGVEVEFWKLARVLLRWLLLALTAAAGCIVVMASLLVTWTVPGMDPATAALATRLLRITACSVVLAGGALSYTSILQARERFALPALAAALQNATVVAAILLLARRLSAMVVAFAVIVGAAGRNSLLRRGAAREGMTGWLWRSDGSPRLRLGPEARVMLADFLPATVAFSIIYLNGFIDRFYASRLGAGGISALNYADKLTQVPLAVLGSAVSIAIIPIFTRHLREHRLDRVRRDLLWSLGASMGMATLLAAAIMVLRLTVIQLLFGNDRLSAAATALAATAMWFYALTIVPETGIMILMRVFHAQRNIWTPALITLVALGTHIAMAAILAPRWGIRGIGVALVSSSFLYLAVMASMVGQRLWGRSDGRKVAAGAPA